ncbi:PEP/pyruvate-binding domain-containing protein [Sinomonas terrae]|uniref:PEP-utilizing enzyme n=1 Tax=Sinomonas terrae TaxID=2908838 RepID=A0ABS9U4Y4_9MICC|nr:PEP/pyruvate-binding domain-containing protein [Sinomonas terrae]MCH6471743.1 PEP-utilizing enzyme [Sinomonas terrae]
MDDGDLSASGAPSPLTLPLESLRAADLPRAGGKGANLGELLAAGLPVPPGFVVPTAVYRAHAEAPGVDPEQAAKDPAKARAAITQTPLDPALLDAIAAALAKLPAGGAGTGGASTEGPRVAVRSSATAEDLPGAAFAGQQDTFLNVEGNEGVADAIRRCWASLWTDRAVQYRERQGIAPSDVAIAVVVQRMVDAEAAGVLFTANPLTGRRSELVVDAARGLGEAVVSGEVTPEHLVLGRDGEVRSRVSGRDGQVLSEDDAKELAALAVRAEEHFGVPQDIEWAVADGRVMLLQARPMTALPLEPPTLNGIQRIVAPFFLEMFTVRPYPLDVTGWLGPGVIRMLDLMAGSVGVRFPPLTQLLREREGVALQLVPPQPRPTFRTIGAPLALIRRVRRYRSERWTEDPRVREFGAAIAALDAETPSSLTWHDLLDRVDRCNSAMVAVGLLRAAYLPGALLPVVPLRALLAVLGLGRLASALVAGAPTSTRAGNDALEGLADVVRGDPALGEAARGLGPDQFLQAIRNRPEFAAFNSELTKFLAEYGHRESVSVVIATAPAWRDDPTPVVALIQSLAQAPRPEPMERPGEEALRELLAHPLVRGPAARLATGLVEASRRGFAFREDTHALATKVMPPLRATFVELGRRLRGVGAIAASEDVFHLRLEELRALPAPEAIDDVDRSRVRDLVARRAALRREYAGVPMLDLATVLPAGAGTGGAGGGAAALLTGTAASGGVAEGPVRIIRGPAEFGDLRSGEVLVCPNTNPSWTPLFARAAAVVVDTGGLGSHAAIVAREYGVPAVMGTGRGTSTLKDGQRVRVDGSRGRVEAV